MFFFVQLFVVLIVMLTTFVVVLTYVCILPVKWANSTSWAAYHLVVGHWLLINVVFHYFKAAFTNPGQVPPVSSLYCFKNFILYRLKVLTWPTRLQSDWCKFCPWLISLSYLNHCDFKV